MPHPFVFAGFTMLEETAAPYTKDHAKRDYKRWKEANTAFHNGEAIMSDAEFDRLTLKLKPFYPGITKAFGAAPMAKHASARKVRLEVPMNSLDKVFGARDDFTAAVKKYLGSSQEAVVVEKVDGASLQLRCDKAGVKKLYSRGKSGTGMGQDVSHLIPLLEQYRVIGSIAPGETIRFELVIPRGASKELDADESKKRNAVSGLVNARTPDINRLKKCWGVGLAFMEPALAPERAYKKLKKKGWRTPKGIVCPVSDLSERVLAAYWDQWRKRARYDIDGIVIFANVAEKPTMTNPKRGFAFKVNEKGPTTEVVRVRWQVSRYGQMKPVCDIKPVMIEGVKVTKATAHNAKYVVDNKLGPGALIEVVRSGGVIPYIVGVERPSAKAALPKAGTYAWDSTKVNINTIDTTHSIDIQARHLQNFFQKIGVLGFGPKVSQLVAELSVSDVISLTAGGWASRGAGSANADKMPTAIKAALKNTSVPTLMAASGVFGQGFGDSSAKDLWMVVQEQAPRNKAALARELAALPGWSTESAVATAAKWSDWVKWFNSLPYKPSTKKKAVADGPLKGKIVVFTKVRDQRLADDIVKAGGLVADSVTKATTHVVYLDGQESLKTKKAADNGATLLPYSKARARLKLA